MRGIDSVIIAAALCLGCVTEHPVDEISEFDGSSVSSLQTNQVELWHAAASPNSQKTGGLDIPSPLLVSPEEYGTESLIEPSCDWGANPAISYRFFGGTGGWSTYFEGEGTCWKKLYYAVEIYRTSDQKHILGVRLAYYIPNRGNLLADSFTQTGTQFAFGYASGYSVGWQNCPAGQVIVGVRGRAFGPLGPYIHSIGFACKSLIDGSITAFPEIGAISGSWYEWGCDWENAVLDTEHVYRGAFWDGFEVRCKRPTGNTVFWLQ